MITDEIIKTISEKINKSSNLIFLTGAGISKESGIPTFRDRDGLWRNNDPAKLASYSAFINNPKLVWEFFHDRQESIRTKEPNKAHFAISEIELLKKSWLLTQNIDGLHSKAGTKNIIELHGNIFNVKCIHCNLKDEFDINSDIPPLCNDCGSVLKPDVVLFEEPLDKEDWNIAIDVASSCDVMIIVGTSLEVGPVNTLPNLAYKNNGFIVEINLQDTWFTPYTDFSFRYSGSVILPKIAENLR